LVRLDYVCKTGKSMKAVGFAVDWKNTCCNIAFTLIEVGWPGLSPPLRDSGISSSFRAIVLRLSRKREALTPSSPKTGITPLHQRFFVDYSSQNR
jgi:hypothetical protein